MKKLLYLVLALSLILPASAFADLNPGYVSEQKIANKILDPLIWANTTTGVQEHAIHSGEAFLATDVKDIAQGDVAVYLISTDCTAPEYIHFEYLVGAEKETSVVFYEDPTEGAITLADTTSLDSVCQRRYDIETSCCKVYDISSAIGVVSGDRMAWSNVSANFSFPSRTPIRHFVLSNDIGYLLYIKNEDASNASQTTSIFNWHQHENR